MAVYTTTKCGHCGQRWETLNRGKHSLMGPPVVKCSYCDKLSKTGFKLYSTLNWFEKIRFWSGQSFRAILYGIGGLGFGLAWLVTGIEAFISLLDKDITSNENFVGNIIGGLIIWIIIPIGLIYFGISELKHFKHVRQIIQGLESQYESNGGFIESDKWF